MTDAHDKDGVDTALPVEAREGVFGVFRRALGRPIATGQRYELVSDGPGPETQPSSGSQPLPNGARFKINPPADDQVGRLDARVAAPGKLVR